jgi:hypothetical protein
MFASNRQDWCTVAPQNPHGEYKSFVLPGAIAAAFPQLVVTCSKRDLLQQLCRNDLTVRWEIGGQTICCYSWATIGMLNRVFPLPTAWRQRVKQIYTMLRGDCNVWQHLATIIASFLLQMEDVNYTWRFKSSSGETERQRYTIPLYLPFGDQQPVRGAGQLFCESRLSILFPQLVAMDAPLLLLDIAERYDESTVPATSLPTMPIQHKRLISYFKPVLYYMIPTERHLDLLLREQDCSNCVATCLWFGIQGPTNIDSVELRLVHQQRHQMPNNHQYCIDAMLADIKVGDSGIYALSLDRRTSVAEFQKSITAGANYIDLENVARLRLRFSNSLANVVQRPLQISVYWQLINIQHTENHITGFVYYYD